MCRAGWGAEDCSLEAFFCGNCTGHGTCVNANVSLGIRDSYCSCIKGYIGKHCEVAILGTSATAQNQPVSTANGSAKGANASSSRRSADDGGEDDGEDSASAERPLVLAPMATLALCTVAWLVLRPGQG